MPVVAGGRTGYVCGRWILDITALPFVPYDIPRVPCVRISLGTARYIRTGSYVARTVHWKVLMSNRARRARYISCRGSSMSLQLSHRLRRWDCNNSRESLVRYLVCTCSRIVVLEAGSGWHHTLAFRLCGGQVAGRVSHERSVPASTAGVRGGLSWTCRRQE